MIILWAKTQYIKGIVLSIFIQLLNDKFIQPELSQNAFALHHKS